MKAFLAILFLFTILLLGIGINYFYVTSLTQELIEDLERLPSPNESEETFIQANQICQKWQLGKRIVQITVNHAEIEIISNAATELCVYARHSQTAEFEKARCILISTLENLNSAEKLSLINIL